jgi:hypothetical protein
MPAAPVARGGIEIILAGNSDQHEQGIAPRVSQGCPIRRGLTVSATAQTGQSEAIHSPEACASNVLTS